MVFGLTMPDRHRASVSPVRQDSPKLSIFSSRCHRYSSDVCFWLVCRCMKSFAKVCECCLTHFAQMCFWCVIGRTYHLRIRQHKFCATEAVPNDKRDASVSRWEKAWNCLCSMCQSVINEFFGKWKWESFTLRVSWFIFRIFGKCIKTENWFVVTFWLKSANTQFV